MRLSYRIPHAGNLHGFAGYFEAHLYGTVGLSIHPERMQMISPDMMSWFPLFFPIKVSVSPYPTNSKYMLTTIACRTRCTCLLAPSSMLYLATHRPSIPQGLV